METELTAMPGPSWGQEQSLSPIAGRDPWIEVMRLQVEEDNLSKEQ